MLKIDKYISTGEKKITNILSKYLKDVSQQENINDVIEDAIIEDVIIEDVIQPKKYYKKIKYERCNYKLFCPNCELLHP